MEKCLFSLYLVSIDDLDIADFLETEEKSQNSKYASVVLYIGNSTYIAYLTFSRNSIVSI